MALGKKGSYLHLALWTRTKQKVSHGRNLTYFVTCLKTSAVCTKRRLSDSFHLESTAQLSSRKLCSGPPEVIFHPCRSCEPACGTKMNPGDTNPCNFWHRAELRTYFFQVKEMKTVPIHGLLHLKFSGARLVFPKELGAHFLASSSGIFQEPSASWAKFSLKCPASRIPRIFQYIEKSSSSHSWLKNLTKLNVFYVAKNDFNEFHQAKRVNTSPSLHLNRQLLTVCHDMP